MTLVHKLPAAIAASLPAASFAEPVAGFALDNAPRSYETLEVEVDTARRAFWFRFNPQGRPCFNPQLLRDISAVHDAVDARFRAAGSSAAMRHSAIWSAGPPLRGCSASAATSGCSAP
jgi:hypothetical protein